MLSTLCSKMTFLILILLRHMLFLFKKVVLLIINRAPKGELNKGIQEEIANQGLTLLGEIGRASCRERV